MLNEFLSFSKNVKKYYLSQENVFFKTNYNPLPHVLDDAHPGFRNLKEEQE